MHCNMLRLRTFVTFLFYMESHENRQALGCITNMDECYNTGNKVAERSIEKVTNNQRHVDKNGNRSINLDKQIIDRAPAFLICMDTLSKIHPFLAFISMLALLIKKQTELTSSSFDRSLRENVLINAASLH